MLLARVYYRLAMGDGKRIFAYLKGDLHLSRTGVGRR